MVSPIFNRPLRTIPEASAAVAARREPVKFRFYVSGYAGCDWDTVPAWGPTPDAAMDATRQHYPRLARPEIDLVPDAMVLRDGTFVPLDRAAGQKIALAMGFGS